MSDTGMWGSQIIVTLHSDGERRHQKWCVNYTDDYCKYYCEKCRGSAHCSQYKNKHSDGTSVFRPKETDAEPVDPPKPGFMYREYYRLAGFNEKLLNKTVLIKNTPYTLRFGFVTAEDWDFIYVEYDGKVHKHQRLTVYRSQAIYVYDGIKEEEITVI